MMEGPGGASITEIRARNGIRQSVFRSYVAAQADRPNLTVITDALVSRVLFTGNRAVGVEVIRHGTVHHIEASTEVVLSLGAVHTPKVLMQSGIGDHAELTRHGSGHYQVHALGDTWAEVTEGTATRR